jgi:uncharacterized protein (DUF2236 family)
MAIRETIHQPVPHVERRMADPPRPQQARRRRALGIDEGLMGVALLGRVEHDPSPHDFRIR